MASPARILIADHSSLHNVLLEALSGYENSICSTFESARELLNDKFDLIVCGIHFDESRMVDLLSETRRHPLHKETPFIVFRGIATGHKELLRRSIKPLMETFDLGPYVELETFSAMEHPSQELRTEIEKNLPVSKLVPAK